ncbi:hypothetical protein BJ508DRAFT_331124 [Ascobolus immersus RN42]|uniref:Uncharacterized protein n=1 Tax=Ascobolus immersus RN42 TaxID=1160509 RepID=A0A3N4HRI6_ASCIM|nr:hypothetical protein BJ508DRAFT_331124 [Ascobolus immersus RN42]
MDRFYPPTEPHDNQTPSDFNLRPSPSFPFTHGDYFNSILQWTDSFLRLDQHAHEPIEWIIPRILARAFLCRVSNIQVMPPHLLPEAIEDRILFVIIYTISMFRFFGVTEGANDPHWIRAFIHSYELNTDDLPAAISTIQQRFDETQLVSLAQLLAEDNPNPGHLQALEYQEEEPVVIDIDTLEPLNPIDPKFETSDQDTLMYDGSGPTYVPVPLPPMPAVRITPNSIEIARNVAISMPGLQVWSYDTPPPLQHVAISNLEQQMAVMQQAIQLLATGQVQQPLHSPPIRDTTMDDAPPESYTTGGALPRITISPPSEGVQSDNRTESSLNPSLHQQLASLSLTSPPTRPLSTMSGAHTASSAAKAMSRSGSQQTTPSGSRSATPSGSRANITTDPPRHIPIPGKDVEKALADAAAGSLIDKKSEPPVLPAPASEAGQTEPDVKIKPDLSSSSTSPGPAEPGPDELERNRAIRAQQAKEFEEGKLLRLREENARLTQKAKRLEATVQERNIQNEIKLQHELRQQTQERIAAAEALIAANEKENNSKRAAALRQSLQNKVDPQHPMQGTFEDVYPSLSSPIPVKPSNFDVDSTLAYLSKQAPDALEMIKQRLIHTDVPQAPPGGHSSRFKQHSDDARFNWQQQTRSSSWREPDRSSRPQDPYRYETGQSGSTGNDRHGGQPPRHGGPPAGAPGDDPGDDSEDSDYRSIHSNRSRPPAKPNKRRELPGKPVHVADKGHAAALPSRRQATPAYLGRMPIHSLEPDFYEDPATCRAPDNFVPTFPYDDTLPRYNNKMFNDRWDSRRMPVYHESKTTLDSWLTKLHVEIAINGQEAVCPLIGPKGLPEGTFLHRWYNNLNHIDLILLTMGPNPWYNWQYAICSLREHLNPLIRSQAESRVKLPDETYHAYITTRYPLLKAAFPYEPETEIIRRIKTGFIDENAYTFMREQVDIRRLERESLEYEEMRTAMAKNKPLGPQMPTSSYLRASGAYSHPADEDKAQMFVATRTSYRNKYQQKPATSHNVYPVPADVVRDADLDPAIKKGRRSIPVEQMDPRARTVNMRTHPDTKVSVRCYIRDNCQYVCLDRPCSKCQRAGLTPDDHFSFEHNLYHDDNANTASTLTMGGNQDFVYQSSSDDESENDLEG